ncbi:hypothetical protein AB0D32_07105 [Micromonospora sp. NPDC048170]|uniref:hypothetical protein n=1 Tax=Micromonospora sp. NPDC048170 TaxID=3154819 RepID=UPI0033F7FF2A
MRAPGSADWSIDVDDPVVGVGEFVMADEAAYCALDRRLGYAELSLCRETASARLSVVDVADVASFTPEYRDQLGIGDRRGAVRLVGGGLGQFRAGVWASPVAEPDRQALITDLVRRAVDEARRDGVAAVSPFVGAADLDAFTSTAGDVHTRAQASWCSLPIDAAGDVDQFIDGQERKCRQTWRRDQRDAERLGLTYDVVPLDDEHLRAAAPLVAEVARRNGLDEHVRIAQWRVKNYLRRPGRHFLIRSSASGQALAYTVCRRWGRTLDAHTVGLDGRTPQRRSVYHFAAYLAPLRVAISAGLRRLDLGLAHEQPKLVRGCEAEPMWFVDYRG